MSARRRIRRPARLAAGLVALLASSLALVGAAPIAVATTTVRTTPDGAAPVTARTGGLELELGGVSPAAPGPDDELVVRGTIRNGSAAGVGRTRITIWLRPEVLAGRSAIGDWLERGETEATDLQLPAVVTVKSLAAGATRRFTVTIPPGRTGLYRYSDFGPRAIYLSARASGVRPAVLRSTLVWVPSETSARTRLSVVVPITSTEASTYAGSATPAAAADLAPDGRLDRVLAAADDPAMAWAVDPAVLAAADRISRTGVDTDLTSAVPSPSPGSASPSPVSSGSPAPASPGSASPASPGSVSSPPSTITSGSSTGTSATTGPPTGPAVEAKVDAADWLTRFRTGTPGRGVLALPYADPDLVSVLRGRSGLTLIDTADQLGRKATRRVLGGSLDTSVAWPADGRISTAVARNLVRAGYSTAILDGGLQRPDPPLEYTPTGRTVIRTSSGTLGALLYDRELSALIGAGDGRTPAATQTMLAELAAITRQEPDVSRHLLAVTPRDWDPDPVAVRTMMNALGSAPWISLRGIGELREASGPARRAPVYRQAWTADELPPGNTSLALRLDSGLTAFSPVLTDADAIVQPLRERIASLLSVAWRDHPEQLRIARAQVQTAVTGLVDGVELEIGTRSKLVTGRSAKIPVTVNNGTPYPVRVVVRLRPASGQLAVDASEVFTAPPRTRLPVYPNVRAVASGDVTVEAKLMTPTGVALGPGKDFMVRVRPDWETRGMIIAGSILGFMVLIGLLRGIRRDRGRDRVPIDAVPDVDEQATERAAAAADGEPDPDAGASRPDEPPAGAPDRPVEEPVPDTVTGGPGGDAVPSSVSSASAFARTSIAPLTPIHSASAFVTGTGGPAAPGGSTMPATTQPDGGGPATSGPATSGPDELRMPATDPALAGISAARSVPGGAVVTAPVPVIRSGPVLEPPGEARPKARRGSIPTDPVRGTTTPEPPPPPG